MTMPVSIVSRKTMKKMSPRGLEAAAALDLSPRERALVQRAAEMARERAGGQRGHAARWEILPILAMRHLVAGRVSTIRAHRSAPFESLPASTLRQRTISPPVMPG